MITGIRLGVELLEWRIVSEGVYPAHCVMT
jgi:hypothetical protein